MGTDDLIRKFVDCAAYSRKRISPEARQKLIEAILNLEEQDNMTNMIACLNESFEE